MSKPATRQRMLRQLLLASLDAPAPRQITFADDDEHLTVHIDAESREAAAALVAALHLSDRAERGQPYPHNGPPVKCWTGSLNGRLFGWKIQVKFEAPFTSEYVTQWEAQDGFKRYGTPRPAESEQVANA
jgi:hypothetical protein